MFRLHRYGKAPLAFIGMLLSSLLLSCLLLSCLLLSCLLVPSQAIAAEVMVAVASNFTAPMKDIAARFQQHSGHRLIMAFGSSGKFTAQIHNGGRPIRPSPKLLSAPVLPVPTAALLMR